MTEVNALADRAEAATGPDRELDCLIHLVRNPEIQIMTDTGGYRNERPVEYTKATDLAPKWKGGWADFASIIDAPAYTASVDAALMLLPEGFSYSLYVIIGKPPSVRLWGWHDDQQIDVLVKANTPALALVAAALRAPSHDD